MTSSRPVIVAIALVALGCAVTVVALVLWANQGAPDEPAGSGASAVSTLAGSRAQRDGVVAVFGGKNITRAEYEERWRRTLEKSKLTEDQLAIAEYLESRYRVLRELVDLLIYDQGMKDFGLTYTDDDVREQGRRLADSQIESRHVSAEALSHYLQARNVTLDEYRAEVATELYTQRREELEIGLKEDLLVKAVTGGIEVADDQVPNYLKAVDVRRITQLLSPPLPGDTPVSADEAKARVEEAYAKLQSGAKFEDVVRQYSNGPEREADGLMRGLRWGLVNKAFDEVCWSLKEGQVSQPFQTDTGWHIIKVERFHTIDPSSLSEPERAATPITKDEIQRTLRGQAWDKWLNEKFNAGQLEIKDPALGGYHAYLQGRTQEAKPLLEQARQSTRGIEYLSVVLTLTQIEYELKNNDAAEQLFAELLNAASEEQKASVLFFRASFYAKTDRQEAALADLAACSAAAREPEEHFPVAHAYAQLNRADLGKAELRKALGMTDAIEVIRGVAEIAASNQWTDVLEEARQKVARMQAALQGAQQSAAPPGAGQAPQAPAAP